MPEPTLSQLLADHRTSRPREDHAQATLDAARDDLTARLRSSGEERSSEGDREWVERAIRYVWELRPGDHVDADDLRDLFGRSMAAGAVFGRCQKAGWLRCIGYAVSSSPTRHGGLIRKWERA